MVRNRRNRTWNRSDCLRGYGDTSSSGRHRRGAHVGYNSGACTQTRWLDVHVHSLARFGICVGLYDPGWVKVLLAYDVSTFHLLLVRSVDDGLARYPHCEGMIQEADCPV